MNFKNLPLSHSASYITDFSRADDNSYDYQHPSKTSLSESSGDLGRANGAPKRAKTSLNFLLNEPTTPTSGIVSARSVPSMFSLELQTPKTINLPSLTSMMHMENLNVQQHLLRIPDPGPRTLTERLGLRFYPAGQQQEQIQQPLTQHIQAHGYQNGTFPRSASSGYVSAMGSQNGYIQGHQIPPNFPQYAFMRPQHIPAARSFPSSASKIISSRMADYDSDDDRPPKYSHKIAERKRRKDMNDTFDELRDCLPAKLLKMSKWEVLSNAADHINHLHSIKNRLIVERETLHRELGLPVAETVKLQTYN